MVFLLAKYSITDRSWDRRFKAWTDQLCALSSCTVLKN